MEEQRHVILRKQTVSPCCSLNLTLQNGHKLHRKSTALEKKKSAFHAQLKAKTEAIFFKKNLS